MNVAAGTVNDDVAERARTSRALGLFLSLGRITLGWYVLFSGWQKVQSELEFGIGWFYNSNQFQPRGDFMPAPIAVLFGYPFPWAEALCGALVTLGLFSRFSLPFLVVMLSIISGALTMNGEYFPRHHVMVFLCLALILAVLGPGSYSLDRLLKGRSARS